MALFKSKEERRIQREMAVKKALNRIRKQIVVLEKNEKGYVEKAKRAKAMNSKGQFEFLKKALKKTMAQRIMMERQLLNVEIANQMGKQMESYNDFSNAMNTISKSIATMFSETDLAKTQKNFETSMSKAKSMEERMDIFLEMTSEAMMDETEYQGGTEVVSDDDIEKMIDEGIMEDESKDIDKEIEQGLSEVKKEIENK